MSKIIRRNDVMTQMNIDPGRMMRLCCCYGDIFVYRVICRSSATLNEHAFATLNEHAFILCCFLESGRQTNHCKRNPCENGQNCISTANGHECECLDCSSGSGSKGYQFLTITDLY